MKIDTSSLLDAIDRYIAKAEDDLENTLSEEGFVATKDAIIYINRIEDGITALLNEHTDELLKELGDKISVDDFIEDIWKQIQERTELPSALEKIFFENFSEMMHKFTNAWLELEAPVLANLDDRITKSGEAFVKEWSSELANMMHLSTNQQIDRLLIKAVKKKWSIKQLQEAIEDSGIRACGYRARRVAVTETLRLESYSQLESMIQNPLCYKKKWKHVMSENYRENHRDMDNEKKVVFKRDKFELIGKDGNTTYFVMCPRDTSLPAEETVNCHCIMESIKDDNIFGMTNEELKEMRLRMMDEVDAELDNGS